MSNQQTNTTAKQTASGGMLHNSMGEGQMPTVTFSMQSVVSNYPNEKHEAIDITPELVQFANQCLTSVQQLRDEAKGVERFALSISRGERSWRENGGPKKSINADHLVHVVNLLILLSEGRNANSWSGWIDRAEWKKIVEVVLM